ncbi:inositol-pentakisphosphate 2-kinase IPK1 isoform X3 [Elaeis guineensis]|uniref:Inositol-pentakisphosphate 2-kinase n=1 Tax=Elaeis guineensis var. tenera TaxID=51953 RepID=A0A6I9SB42_ELAGV|nr:inositol-pentakisphosphate 2-kinase IPK1 isoform X1 [Elaeis guineensis]XP_029124365.1 inositol-pentakisphosphate 2-kinase IPK1 isoform X1 [Elaeis guineensis]
MAMLLRAEDAKDWIYKGEGAANIVLSYRGSSLFLLGKVLRIQKVPKGSTKSVNGCAVLSRHEKLLWGDVEELVESKSKDIAQQNYIKHVMSHMLGPKYIDEGTYVTVSREFLESVEKNVHDQRPAWRINAAEVDTSCDSAFLISDHSVFTGTPRGDFCVAVEIKPKCGFLPSSEFITKANAIKKSVTRFRMHQFLKLHQGEISNISEYNPLDLFSGSKDRIYQAITTLFATPQNNFRIFLNGSLIFGGLGGGMDSAAVRSHEENTAIKDLIKVSGLQLPGFLELVAEAIFSSGVLDKLLATQKLDVLDIEGAIHAYYNIISQPCMVCKNLGDPELLDQYSLLHSFPLDKSLKILRDYLIAATAKDCSLMISFRPVQGGSAASGYNSIFLESSNQNFEYKAYFIDLDMKPLEKMVHYYELDQKIVIFYMKSKDLGGSLCDSITQGELAADADLLDKLASLADSSVT